MGDASEHHGGGKHFTCADDVVLLREALAQRPWRARRIMAAWEQVAMKLLRSASFPDGKDGKALSTRFQMLVKKHRDKSIDAMRKSGREKDLQARVRLLNRIDTDLIAHQNGKPETAELDTSDSDTSVRPRKKQYRGALVEMDPRDSRGHRELLALEKQLRDVFQRQLDQHQRQLSLQREQLERQAQFQVQQLQLQQQQLHDILKVVEKTLHK